MNLKDKKFLSIIIVVILISAGITVATTYSLKTLEQKQEDLSVKIFADSSVGIAPFDVSFSSLVINQRGNLEYEWDFGDGRNSNENEPLITYSQEGNYNCSLKITDESGATQIDSMKILVKKNKPPVVTLSISQSTINREFNWLEILTLTPIASYAGNKQIFLDAVEERKGTDAWGEGRIVVTAQIMDPEDDEIVSYEWKVQTADTLVTNYGKEILPVKNLTGEKSVTIPELYAWVEDRHIVTLTVTDSAGNKASANIDYMVSSSSKLTSIQSVKNLVVNGLPFLLLVTGIIWGFRFVEEPISNILDEIWLDLSPRVQSIILAILGFLNWGYEPPSPKADLQFPEIADINLSLYVNETGVVQAGAQVKSFFSIENNDSTNAAKNIFVTLKNPITNEQGLDDELEIEELTAELIAGILSTKLFYKGSYISWENCYSIEQLSPGDASTLDLSFSLKEGAVLNKGSYQCTLYIYQEKAPNKAEYIDEIPFTIII